MAVKTGQCHSSTTWNDAPTHTLSAGGVEFAYRELGPSTGVPVVFLTHLAAVLDNWDPRVVDGIAAKHRVIAFRQPRCRRLQWVHAEDHRGDGEGRRRLHPCPGL
jgi:pimeloyl-ACP methyl ester carboxylesterase